jgi:hypothetical protein
MSLTVNTRAPMLTFARMGLSAVSNASSVTLNSVMCTGTTRFLPSTSRIIDASTGAISIIPPAAMSCSASNRALAG